MPGGGGDMSAKGEQPGDGRLDNFVDAAFAFALSMLVIAEARSDFGFADLLAALWRLPIFAGGFALVATFWWAHVSWRRAGGRNDGISTLISLALVFVVMIYVYPTRVMLVALGSFVKGENALRFADAAKLFMLYGAGFALMAGLITALFGHGIRAGHLASHQVSHMVVWGVMTGSGLLSVLLAQFTATILVAPWTYTLLPVAIPLALSIQRRLATKEAGATD